MAGTPVRGTAGTSSVYGNVSAVRKSGQQDAYSRGMPRKRAECYACHKIGHYGRACRSKGRSEAPKTEAPAQASGSAAYTAPAASHAKIDSILRPKNALSRAMSLEESNLWFTRFEAYLDWNQVALESGNGPSKRQLLNDCLESDLASALLTYEQITPDTPIKGATGCLARLKKFFPEEENDICETIRARPEEPPGSEFDVERNNDRWIPPWELSGSKFDLGWNGEEIPRSDTGYLRSLLDVALGAGGFFEDSRWNVCGQDNYLDLAGVSTPVTLGTAKPRTRGSTGGGVEQLELSLRNLAPELRGLDTHDSPSRGAGSPGLPF